MMNNYGDITITAPSEPTIDLSFGSIGRFAVGLTAVTVGTIIGNAFLNYSTNRVMQEMQKWDPTVNQSKSELSIPKKKIAIIPRGSYLANWLNATKNKKNTESWRDLFSSIYRTQPTTKSFGYTPSQYLAFTGPAGIGKSKSAEELARRMGAQFLCLSGTDIVTKQYVNSGVPALDSFLTKAVKVAKKRGPTVAFIDEFGLQKREEKSKHTGFDNAALESLLNFCNTNHDNLTLIIATNMDPGLLDPALVRPGRFEIVTMGYPDRETRLKLLKKLHAKSKKLYKSAFDYLDTVARLTEGFSGSDLEGLLKNAVRIAEENCETTGNDAITESDIDVALLSALENKMLQCDRNLATGEANNGVISEKGKEKTKSDQDDLEEKRKESPEYQFYKNAYDEIRNKPYLRVEGDPIRGHIDEINQFTLLKRFYKKFNSSPYVKYPVYGVGLYTFSVYGLYRYRDFYLPYLSTIMSKAWNADFWNRTAFSIPLSLIQPVPVNN